MSMKPTFKLLAAATLGLAGVTAAQAAPIITSWDYQVSGVWSDYAPSSVTLSNSDKTLSWGTPASSGGVQSSLVITNPPSDSVDTRVNGSGGTTGNGITITHNNFVITGGDYLTGATLTASLSLTPTAPPGGTLTPPSIDYNISFTETPNEAPCASNNPSNGVPCNDIFVLLNNETLQQQFTVDGNTYTANIFAAAGNKLRDLTDAECAAADVGNGCRGFATIENASTPLSFGFTISTVVQAVPEPGILALLGIGFAGVGFVNRRRRSSTAA